MALIDELKQKDKIVETVTGSTNFVSTGRKGILSNIFNVSGADSIKPAKITIMADGRTTNLYIYSNSSQKNIYLNIPFENQLEVNITNISSYYGTPQILVHFYE